MDSPLSLGAYLHEQPHRVLQQADKEDAEEADPVRGGGGPGEEDRLDVPPLQRGDREKEGQMLEGNRCLL